MDQAAESDLSKVLVTMNMMLQQIAELQTTVQTQGQKIDDLQLTVRYQDGVIEMLETELSESRSVQSGKFAVLEQEQADKWKDLDVRVESLGGEMAKRVTETTWLHHTSDKHTEVIKRLCEDFVVLDEDIMRLEYLTGNEMTCETLSRCEIESSFSA